MEALTALASDSELMDSLQKVKTLDTLDPLNITIKCWSYDKRNFEEIIINDIYPFNTINDLKLRLYKQKQSSVWLPQYVFFGEVFGPVTEGPKDRFKTIGFAWNTDDDQSQSDIGLYLISPLKVTNQNSPPNYTFVDTMGQQKNNSVENYHKKTIEDTFISLSDITIYAFALDDLLLNFGVAEDNLPSKSNWYGRFSMYFPAISYDTIKPSLKNIKDTDLLLQYETSNNQIISNIETLIVNDPQTINLSIENILALQLLFDKSSEETTIPFVSVEDTFFETDVNSRRPFTRFLPLNNEPITKIHIKGVLPIPDIRDYGLLFQWKLIENPDDNGDYMFMKILTKDIENGGLPVYGTLQIYHDGAATFTVLPSKQHRRGLDPQTDLKDLDKIIFEATEDTFLKGRDLLLNEISLTLSLKLETKQKQLTKSLLQKRVKYFSPFLQEIPIYATELPNPIIFLRYKAVSNYESENNIFTFIRQIIPQFPNLSVRYVPPEFIAAIASEFNLTHEDAIGYYHDFLDRSESFQVLAPELGTFTPLKNSGIDIVIYGKFPLYFVRISRCQSIYHLRRINTILSLFLTTDIVPSINPEVEEKVKELEPVINEIVEVENTKISKRKQLEDELYLDNYDASDDVEEAKAEGVDSGKQLEFDDLDFFGGSVADLDLLPNAESGGDSGANDLAANQRLGVRTLSEDGIGGSVADQDLLPNAESDGQEAIRHLAEKQHGGSVSSSTGDQTPLPAKLEGVSQPTAEQRGGSAPSATWSQTPLRGGAKPKPPINKDEDPNLRAKSYYLIQLNKADPRLFDFKPALADQHIYSRKCQVESHKQPIVLSQKEYDRMVKEYAEDADFRIIEFPLPADSPEPTINENTLTVMKYGTDPSKPNYYMCPQYFCLADRIPIKKSEFKGTEWRPNYQHDYPKEKDTCPFCGGKLIINVNVGRVGYTVLERGTLKKSDTVPTDISFTKDTSHPENFELPCCVGKSKIYSITDKAFAPFLKFEKKKNIAAEAVPLIEEQDEEDEGELIDYTMIRSQLDHKYILTADKHPLAPGKFALLSSGLDKYFGQNSSSLVKRVISQKISKVKGAKGFLRMGVHSNLRLDDPNRFFGLLAPYIHKNTIDEVRQRCREVFTPKIFLHANFGNLVLEFYDPCQPIPTQDQLAQWMNKYFGTILNEKNKYDCQRLFMSYANFINYIDSKTTTKEYRIFAPMLAYKSLFTMNGIIFIILEYNSQDMDKEPRIICPPYGYNPDVHGGCDFAFVLRDETGLYESLFFFEYVAATKTLPESIITHMRFNPEIKRGDAMTSINPSSNIVQRIHEFTSNCEYKGRAIYTSGSMVKTQDLITLSQLMTLPIKKFVEGVVRDIYNHIVGVTFQLGTGRLIPLPVADDGYIPLDLYVHFDWENTPITTADKIAEFYTNYLADVTSRHEGYTIDAILKRTDAKAVSAIRLKNGAIIPARGYVENFPIDLQNIVKNMNAVPEYSLNRSAIVSVQDECAESKQEQEELPEDLATISNEQLEELYQHFRLTFANWLSEVASKDLRNQIEKIILSKQSLPVYEKRKRLTILLHDELSRWFVETEDYIPNKPFIKRRDCLKITNPGKCSDACIWQDSDSSCRIHIPDKAPPLMVLTKELFIQKLIDELILFRQKRIELLERHVKTTVDLKTAIKVDGQWILPDSSTSWIELMKKDWSRGTREEPKFFEEIVVKKPEVNIEGIEVHEIEEVARPEYMYALGDELLDKLNISGQTRLWSLYDPGSLNSLLGITKLSLTDIGLEENSSILTEDAIKLIVQKQKIAVYLIKNTVDSDNISFKLYLPDSYKEQQRLEPYSRTYVQLDYQQDDGSIKSNTTILISNRTFKGDILVNELPSRLQTLYNNRQRMALKGVVEYIHVPTVTLTQSDDINENAPSVPLRITRTKTRRTKKT